MRAQPKQEMIIRSYNRRTPDGSLKPKVSTLLSRIAELEAERRWIPVSERLPEHMQRVIVSNGRSVGEAKYFYFAGVGFRHGWYQIDGMALGASYATHWMPLPEPPEVQE